MSTLELEHLKHSSSSSNNLSVHSDGSLTLGNLQSLNVDSGTLYVDTTNNRVGIGTTTPGVTLELAADDARVKLAHSGGAQFNMGLWDGSNYRLEGDANRPIHITSYANQLDLGTSGSPKVRINSNQLRTLNGCVRLGLNSGGGTVAHHNEFQFLAVETSHTSSGSWVDVAYISHSPCIRFHGSSMENSNGSLGGARYMGVLIGTYGSVSRYQEQKHVAAMNGGNITDIDYRYMNSGAPSGSYRLQCKLNFNAGSHKVTTMIYGSGTAQFASDGS